MVNSKDIEQRTPEWFNARKNMITGSQCGAILGHNPYKKPSEVMRDMVRAYHGLPSSFTGNVATEWGTANEQSAINQYEMFHGAVPVTETGFHIHPEHEWLGASPDGLLGDTGAFEAKCPYGQRDKNPPVFKSLAEQPHYYDQTQTEMYCAEREWVDFYQWAPHGDKLETIDLSQLWIAENIPKLKAFHESFLIERELPNAIRYLEDTHLEQTDQTITDLVDRYSEVSDQIKELDVIKKDLLAEIAERCGGRQSEINGHKLTKVEKKGNVEYKKVPQLKGVDLEKYRKAGTSYWKLS